jgi:hypothetical protein
VRGARGVRALVVAGACIAGAGVAGACQKDPVITTREVTLYAPQSCAPDLANLDAGAFAVYHALGDYEPAPSADGHLLTAGTALPEIDPAARALVVDATEEDREWEGVSPIAPAGAVDVLLLPSTTPCTLRGAVTGGEGVVMGVAGSQRALLVGGSAGGGAGGAPPATVLRLDTGEIEAPGGGARTDATVTAFGAGALVAGGRTSPGGAVLDTALVYDPDSGGFDSQLISLLGPRADAGAAVLATGETLLVGGVGGDGTTVLDSMEIVDPVTRTVRAAGAKLAFALRAPTVLLLASGEIFVAGVVDSGGAPVSELEWFSADASQAITIRTEELVAGSARTYAALEAGGVLAVVSPPASAPASFQNTWVIDPDGVLEAATPIEGDLPQPVLFGGAGGAPVLWTGTSADGAPGRWLRWQPWSGSFAPLVVLDDTPGRIMSAATSPDPGTALWLDTTTARAPSLAALRFDVRGEYSTLAGPLLVSDTTDVAPDRLAAAGVISFDPSLGRLTLEPGASAPGASAFVTDRTYADVRVQVDAPTGQPALIVLRDAVGDELEVGGAACPGAVVTGAPSSLTVERTGAKLTWAVSSGVSGACTVAFGATARVSVGVRAAPDLIQSVASNLRVTRLGSP